VRIVDFFWWDCTSKLTSRERKEADEAKGKRKERQVAHEEAAEVNGQKETLRFPFNKRCGIFITVRSKPKMHLLII
jgi:hypothetical protein